MSWTVDASVRRPVEVSALLRRTREVIATTQLAPSGPAVVDRCEQYLRQFGHG